MLARAADDGGGETRGVAREIGAHDEASHRMAEHDVGSLPRIARSDRLAQFVHVVDEHVLAADTRKATPLAGIGDAFPMPHVIVRADDITAAHQITGEFIVALDVLGHAVHDLHDSGRSNAGAFLGLPRKRSDLGLSIA